MSQLTISVLSTQYVLVPVTATVGGTRIDPTGDVVKMAFVAPGTNPGPSDWQSASWEINTTTTPQTYSAKCLVGPSGGTIALAAGGYECFVKINDTPESPVLKAGPLRVI